VSVLNGLETAPADHQPFFAKIDLPPDRWEALDIAGRRFPPPAHVLVVYRAHVEDRTVETRTFTLDDRQIHVTTSPVEVFGKMRHLGLFVGPDEDGLRQLKWTATDAEPPPTKVGGDEDGVRASSSHASRGTTSPSPRSPRPPSSP
jgi:hypothetical protein